ncbi:MAG: lipoate--protein ligase family protein [Bacteroidetes bacterium]|nr:lipoate--protein ligase family protein [Bacteroidota bacterium]
MATLWYLEDTGSQPGRINMERDESLARLLCEGRGLPTLRLYSWKPWAISLGWHQPWETIDYEKAIRDGIDVVRRPTGGRALLHAEELTYCVVFENNGKSILETYALISRALLTAMRLLGIYAQYEKQSPHFPSLYRSVVGGACFSSAGRYEITVDGKKLIGSAQRRYCTSDGREVILQHGSILIGSAHKNLLEYLVCSNEERNHIQRVFEERTTDLQTILQRPILINEVRNAVQQGFEKCWGLRFITELESIEGNVL